MKSINTFLFLFFGTAMFILTSCGPKYTLEEHETYTLVLNKGEQILGYTPGSGVTLIEKSGYAFKDHNKNGTLDIYEDWRQPVDESRPGRREPFRAHDHLHHRAGRGVAGRNADVVPHAP